MDNAEGDERGRKRESQWRLWGGTAGEEERNVAAQVRAGEAESSGGASDGPATGPTPQAQGSSTAVILLGLRTYRPVPPAASPPLFFISVHNIPPLAI